MRAASCLQLCCLWFAFLTAVPVQGRECDSVNDAIQQLPKDFQDLLKKRIDVYSFKGTVFVPNPTAWNTRDLDPTIYHAYVLERIIDFGIIPGVRFAERPGLKSGTENLESKFEDTKKLLCLNADRPTKEVDVEILVKGSPDPRDSTRYSLEGTAGSTYKAGEGEITIVRVYSDVTFGGGGLSLANLTDLPPGLNVSQNLSNIPKEALPKGVALPKDFNISSIANWKPAHVVKVVQCRNADVFFTDHLLLPCPLCGGKCSGALVQLVANVLLPVWTGLAVALAVAGSLAICCGCKVCSNANGCCGVFWKCVCGSLALIIVVSELFVAAAFGFTAWYLYTFTQRNAMVNQSKWKPHFIWAIVGSCFAGLVAISLLWSFISQGAKRRRSKQHQQFYDAPPPPIYQPVGAAPPIRA